MFSDIGESLHAADASEASKKRARGPGSTHTANSEDLNAGKLDKQMKKLILAAAQMALQDHITLKQNARDENIVIRMAASHPLAQQMVHDQSKYNEQGIEARKSSEFKGHPQGKKPDVLLRCLVYRLAPFLQKTEVHNALTSSSLHEKIRNDCSLAVQTICTLAAGAASQSDNMKATRCFCIDIEKDGTDQVKWILCTNRNIELMSALRTLRSSKLLEVVQIFVEDDFAPISKQAKEVSELLFGKKDGKTSQTISPGLVAGRGGA